ncbi:hypothetical protein EVAR_19170_1 [Eumeta japonica]|uniref:Uncharacterized protein n=1 Tax=Eumeta variegata TaxID=151549 RepID=A0A4C1VMZ3_EUMVA|nr:hypothetical protein EVAR_19170_1 [Eumeta japonica]
MPPRPAPPARFRRRDMCDLPPHAILTTIRDTVSCSWIFYSECRRVAARAAPSPRPALASHDPEARPPPLKTARTQKRSRPCRAPYT